jgi:iron(III) transport system ATP-binding protein
LTSYTIDNLQMTFGRGAKQVTAIHRIDLTIEPGELVVLLGPSGCGKTTTLRCLAGLESATGGRILFGDNAVFDADAHIDVPPNRRNIGMVFQSYALWPHKTVRQNIAYPLQVRGMTTALKEGWVEAAAALVDCGHLLDRYPGQLSGGQQQRVALARGIVARPELVLFDEPLSNLDALLRTQVRKELHELHKRLGFTGVYVTHDQTEAFAIGDRLAVMRDGLVEQVGPPEEIYAMPASEYAANFVGMTSRLSWKRDASGWHSLEMPSEDARHDLPADGDRDQLVLRYRPSAARIVVGNDSAEGFVFRATVTDTIYSGGRVEVGLSCGESHVGATIDPDGAKVLTVGDSVTVVVPWAMCSWFDEQGTSIEVAVNRKAGV